MKTLITGVLIGLMLTVFYCSRTWAKIVFVSDREGNNDIWVMDDDGSSQVKRTNDPADENFPRWSPDGLRIVFSSTRLGGKNLFIINRDGSNVRPLTKDRNSFSPAWAPASSGNDIRVSSRR